LRIDLKEFQETDKFIRIKNILSYSKKYIEISELSDEGIKIRTRQYVGIIKLNNNCILTIEPKAPVEDFLYLLYKSQGKKELIKELKDIIATGREKLKDYPNIFDFLLYLLLFELDKIKKSGFLKSSIYFRDKNKIKGKILVNDTLKNWYRGNSKITCGYFLQSKNNPENQAIKFTLWLLLNIYSEKIIPELRNDFFNKYRWFEDVPLSKINTFLEAVEDSILNSRH
jgi:5-methylcytosine-specific restriction endonuclease McrBC regulatory subunit McrC